MQTGKMSQQLKISSLTSALALVCLCLVARAGGEREVAFEQPEQASLIVPIEISISSAQ